MSIPPRSQPIVGSKHVNREKTDGLLRHTRLENEPGEYLQKREELRLAEMEMFRNIERGIDLLQPVYNMLDLTPQGRGNWYASLDYGTRVNWVPRAR